MVDTLYDLNSHYEKKDCTNKTKQTVFLLHFRYGDSQDCDAALSPSPHCTARLAHPRFYPKHAETPHLSARHSDIPYPATNTARFNRKSYARERFMHPDASLMTF